MREVIFDMTALNNEHQMSGRIKDIQDQSNLTTQPHHPILPQQSMIEFRCCFTGSGCWPASFTWPSLTILARAFLCILPFSFWAPHRLNLQLILSILRPRICIILRSTVYSQDETPECQHAWIARVHRWRGRPTIRNLVSYLGSRWSHISMFRQRWCERHARICQNRILLWTGCAGWTWLGLDWYVRLEIVPTHAYFCWYSIVAV